MKEGRKDKQTLERWSHKTKSFFCTSSKRAGASSHAPLPLLLLPTLLAALELLILLPGAISLPALLLLEHSNANAWFSSFAWASVVHVAAVTAPPPSAHLLLSASAAAAVVATASPAAVLALAGPSLPVLLAPSP